jgi:hypothetical protein
MLSLKQAKRVAVAVIGFSVLLIGLAMIVLPGPAIVVIPLGLGILATEFLRARKLLNRIKCRILKRGDSCPGSDDLHGPPKGSGPSPMDRPTRISPPVSERKYGPEGAISKNQESRPARHKGKEANDYGRLGGFLQPCGGTCGLIGPYSLLFPISFLPRRETVAEHPSPRPNKAPHKFPALPPSQEMDCRASPQTAKGVLANHTQLFAGLLH